MRNLIDRAVGQVTHQVAGYLSDEGTGRMIGDTEDVHFSGRQFDHEERVELCAMTRCPR